MVAPPEPLTGEAGVKTQPFACRHCAFVIPEQVPKGVPMQFGAQKHPGTLRQR